MSPKEERVWRYLVKHRVDDADAVADACDTTPEFAQRLINRISSENWTEPVDPNPDDTILYNASVPLRISCLEEASRLTAGDRNKTYGPPVENMQHIADIFNAWTGRDLTAREVAQLHTATKLARSQTSPTHRDSYVDSMAYRGIEFECASDEDAP